MRIIRKSNQRELQGHNLYTELKHQKIIRQYIPQNKIKLVRAQKNIKNKYWQDAMELKKGK
jgi:hypothetical protein